MKFRHFAIVAALVTVGCQREPSDGLRTVRVAARRHLSAAPLFIADEAGFFREEGIRLEFVEAPMRSTQAIPLLENNSIDVVSSTVSAGMFAASRAGARFKIVADRGHTGAGRCDFNGMVGSKTAFSADSATAATLRGRIISVNSAVTPEFVTDRFLESVGLRQADLKVVSLSETMEPQALNSGVIHLSYATEPYLSQLRKDGHRVLGNISSYADGAHFGVMIFGPTLTVTDREMGKRFMNAYLRGVRRHAEGPTPRNLEMIAKRMGFDSTLLKSACLATIHLDGHVDMEWMMEFQRWAVRKGYLQDSVAADQLIDLSFARASAAHLDSVAPK